MEGFWAQKRKIVLILSMVLFYFMAPLLGYRYEVSVGFMFALLVILGSIPKGGLRNILKYTLYIIVIVLARHSLSCWQPWTFLFDHGLYEPTGWPFVFTSITATLSGWLLLHTWKYRFFLYRGHLGRAGRPVDSAGPFQC